MARGAASVADDANVCHEAGCTGCHGNAKHVEGDMLVLSANMTATDLGEVYQSTSVLVRTTLGYSGEPQTVEFFSYENSTCFLP